MSKPSERIVVFVTTAQKRAITTTAEDLGISVSELMRRAVLSFGATSEQVKAASIVDRLRAPRAPDALNAALQRVARGTRYARASAPAAVPTREIDSDTSHSHSAADAPNPPDAAGISASASTATPDQPVSTLKASPAASVPPSTLAPAHRGSLLPAGVVAALAAEQDEQVTASAEALARLIAGRAADSADTTDSADTANTTDHRETAERASPPSGTPASLRNSLKRRRAAPTPDDDDPHGDPSTEGGRFA
ncbi:hypothetical protein LJ656_03395 [Paraburkholderia sp. MMS20-SJTR3]|uniref:Ribbon-helix-helix protein, copG family n=1 Tax=Paraburkholderia sejongensis TaxID=2886946 RepID=A0ABS8JP02_9BURK|nr:hypothetical protein [Paraburkholderia sp. MMS20-SJTR3]MCC8391622.1 hypothetical protein [Paraburkholderia sp. MMS20-SJTR3]